MSKMNLIRDVIYDYIQITPIERDIVEDPYFQRLRFIYQNSSAYLTYPSNQLTRFSHSLGVMHIGGLLFRNGFQNPVNQECKERFTTLCRKVIEQKIKDYRIDNTENIFFQNIDSFYIVDSDIKFPSESIEDKAAITIIWQSIRLACLCHDIGHLPFSHIFEMALDEFKIRHNGSFFNSLLDECKTKVSQVFSTEFEGVAKAMDLHEYMGAYLLSNIYEKIYKSKNDPFYTICFGIAIEIFLHEKKSYKSGTINDKQVPDEENIFGCLYTIVSSDLDADRLDYILRDAKSSGIDLGNFDYLRIISNYHLKSTEDIFHFSPSDKCLSSIDQFFNYRYLMYEYVYYHHNVAKYDGVLIEILCLLFHQVVNNENPELRKMCIEDFYLIDESDKLFPLQKKERDVEMMMYEYYDDCWLRNFLQTIYMHREKLSLKEEFIDLLNTFLYRQGNNICSLSKNTAGIDNLLRDEFFQNIINKNQQLIFKYDLYNAESLLDNIKEKRNELNNNVQRNEGSPDGYKEWINKNTPQTISVFKIQEKHIADFRILINKVELAQNQKSIMIEKIQELRTKLKEAGIMLIFKNTPPKLLSLNKQTKMILNVKNSANTSVIKIKDVSYYLKNLQNLTNTHFHYYFGAYKVNIKSDESTKRQFKEYVQNFLLELLEMGLDLELNSQSKQKK